MSYFSIINHKIIMTGEATLLVLCMVTFAFRGASLRSSYLVSLISKRFFARNISNKMLLENPANPLFFTEGKLPSFSNIVPTDHVVPAISSLLKDVDLHLKALEDQLQKAEHINYEDVVESLERLQFPLGFSWGIVNHLMGVKNSDDLRRSHDIIQPKVVEVQQKLGQSRILFSSLRKLLDENKLDEAQQRIVKAAVRQMEYSGVGLDGEKCVLFNNLKLELAELSTKFGNNILDSTKAFKLHITDKTDMDGLPNSAMRLLAQFAVASGYQNATSEDGPWIITLDMPSYLPCMQHLKSRSLRETLYKGFILRASSGEYDNKPIISRILQIKRELAQILGFSSHADKSLSSKMASGVDEVYNLMEMLREKAFPAAQREMRELQDFAKANGFGEENLALWDVPFWSERLRETAYDYKEEDLRVYFPLPTVLQGMFMLASRLFRVKINEITDHRVSLWDKDVRFFKVKDAASNVELASFYLDPYARPGEKRGGAWMDSLWGRSRALGTTPVAYLVCNGSPPVGDTPSLMTFREVETLFHEFGHGLQHMLTKIEYGDAAGITNIEWDAVELPSQFMENWCYDRATLNAISKHYDSGKVLPDDLYSKVKRAKCYQSGLLMLRQLFFATIDMKLHDKSFDPFGAVSPFELYHSLAPLYTAIPPHKEDYFLCSFSHIFSGGYSAGYYSYKYAEVLSADAFSAFEEAGLDDENAVMSTGQRFRDTVLAFGGAKHPSDVFRLFRGRDPTPHALLRHSGLS